MPSGRPMTDPPTPLNNEAAAAYLGIARSTWTTYRSDGRTPDPDGWLGNSPWWYAATLDAWKATRPGRGNHTSGAQRTPGSRRRKT